MCYVSQNRAGQREKESALRIRRIHSESVPERSLSAFPADVLVEADEMEREEAEMSDDDVMFYIALFLAVFFTFTISLLLCWE